MKKLITLFVVAFYAMVLGQNQRFIYEYKYVPDTLQKDSVKSEFMVLDVTKDGSKYFSKAKHDSDSIMQAEMMERFKSGTGSFSIKSSYHGGIRYSVDKEYPDYKVYLNTMVGGSYKVYDDRPMDWKILPATEKIGQWNTQEATTEFAGRKWKAWFSNEIPIPEGPYKFHGLPGLIVKLQSADKTHSFELKGVQKIPEVKKEEKPAGRNIVIMDDKPIPITQKQYIKQKENYAKDPNAGIRQMISQFSNSSNKVVVKVDGKEMSGQELLRDLDKKRQEAKKNKKVNHNNNPIELSDL